MKTVRVSVNFEVTIPAEVRGSLGIQPGQELHVFAYGGRIELVPVREPQALRGFLSGIDTTVERDPDRV
jgi:AbrB family looped-hinge helix DNA binding protein